MKKNRDTYIINSCDSDDFSIRKSFLCLSRLGFLQDLFSSRFRANLFLRKLREGLTKDQTQLMQSVDTSELAFNYQTFAQFVEILRENCPVERDLKSRSFAGILRGQLK